MYIEGRIIKCIGGVYTVQTSADTALDATAKGSFRNEGITPLAGDFVTVNGDKDGYVITEIKERKNSLVRPPLSNLDTLVIVVSSSLPRPSFYNIDKLCIICRFKNIEPIIAVTKTDDRKNCAQEIESIYENCAPVFILSAKTGDGVEALEKYLSGKLCAFAGASGVGKTTLLNRLCKSEEEIGGLSRKTGRGKHTTRHTEIYKTPGGLLIADTPGFSAVNTREYANIYKEDLADLFPEFVPFSKKCEFHDCNHINGKNCAVESAIVKGAVNRSRYESYLRLYEELKDVNHWDE